VSEKHKVRAVFAVEADSPEQARKRVELTMPFFEGNPFVARAEIVGGLPNLPPVSAKQIIRYLASRYANCRRLGRLFSSDDDSELASHYRGVADAYLHEAGFYRQIIRDIKSGDVSTWVCGGRVNSEIGAEVVANE